MRKGLVDVAGVVNVLTILLAAIFAYTSGSPNLVSVTLTKTRTLPFCSSLLPARFRGSYPHLLLNTLVLIRGLYGLTKLRVLKSISLGDLVVGVGAGVGVGVRIGVDIGVGVQDTIPKPKVITIRTTDSSRFTAFSCHAVTLV